MTYADLMIPVPRIGDHGMHNNPENILRLSGVLWAHDVDNIAQNADVWSDHYDDRAKKYLACIREYESASFDELVELTMAYFGFEEATSGDQYVIAVNIVSWVSLQA